jgi:hypothetical protein
MEGFGFTLARDTNNTAHITMAMTPGATAIIGGTGGIIGTITIGTLIGTDAPSARRFPLRERNFTTCDR